MSAAEAGTTAQEFPPHVTLTGFFHRRAADVPNVVAACTAAVDTAVPAGFDGVRCAGPVTVEFDTNDRFIGLQVAAPWLDHVVSAFVGDPSIQPRDGGDEALRPKSWLHMSLSYGEQFDTAREQALVLAEPFRSITAEREWTVALWRRDQPGWERLVAIPVTCGA